MTRLSVQAGPPEISALLKLAFADWVRAGRMARRWDSRQLAARTGAISRSYVDAIERAVFDPREVPTAILRGLAAAIGAPPAEIAPLLCEPPAGSSPPDDDPDGAGGDGQPFRRPPAPEGPDGPQRAGDADEIHHLTGTAA